MWRGVLRYLGFLRPLGLGRVLVNREGERVFGDVPQDAESLGTAAIERFAEDEALRGDLTDDGWMPLQTWAFGRLRDVATDAARYPQADLAMDGLSEGLRVFTRDAVYAAQNGDAGDLAAQVRPRIVRRERVGAVQSALRSLPLTDDPDANAIAIAAALGGGED